MKKISKQIKSIEMEMLYGQVFGCMHIHVVWIRIKSIFFMNIVLRWTIQFVDEVFQSLQKWRLDNKYHFWTHNINSLCVEFISPYKFKYGWRWLHWIYPTKVTFGLQIGEENIQERWRKGEVVVILWKKLMISTLVKYS